MPEREQEQQQRALEPLAERSRADRREQHQEVDLELARAERDDGFLHGEPCAETVRHDEEQSGHDALRAEA
jgi:hypothetical protein